MDINIKVEWVSYFFFFIAALLHIGFFIIETFLFQRPQGYKLFNVRAEDHQAVKIWAFNQGFYNLFFAIGMLIGLFHVTQLEIRLAGMMVSFCGLSMLGAGLVLFFSDKKMRRGALIQMLPPALGFFFLAFHIAGRILK